MNDLTGLVLANSAIVAAGTGGSVDVFANNDTDLIIDINGYYAPPTDAFSNTAVGQLALSANLFGAGNTAFGYSALLQSNNDNNTAIGAIAGNHLTTGIGNIMIGNDAGSQLTTGNYNIAIGNPGASTDSGIIRIGDPSHHTAFVAAGVWQKQTNTGPVPVMIDQFGLMGTNTSSRRYKEDIHDMADTSSNLLRLRPVTFRYKKPYSDGSKPIDYGLIAEEVAEVYPDLVVKNKDGQIETVQYQKLTPMLLNELQKENNEIVKLHQDAEKQSRHVHLQDETIHSLEARLAVLEAMLSSKVATSSQQP